MKTNKTVYVVMCDDINYTRPLWLIDGIFQIKEDAESWINLREIGQATLRFKIEEHPFVERLKYVTINDLLP